MTHLGTLNISYGQKKGQESNCQFNRLNLLACRWQATYHQKVFDKGYNFSSNLTSIGSLNTKLWASKVVGVLIQGISRLPTWESQDKMTFGVTPWPSTKNSIRRRWWLPPSLSHGESCESMFARGSSVHQKCSNYALTNLLFGLCKSV